MPSWFSTVFAVAWLMAGASFAATVNIQVGDSGGSNFFLPASAIINVGDTVIWTNTGTRTHDVTSTDGSGTPTHSPLNSGFLSRGKSYTNTFTTAGTYLYTCTLHANQNGSLTVVANATLVLTSSSLTAPSFTVSNSFAGQTYFIDALTNFGAGAFGARWFPIATVTAASNNFQFSDAVLTGLAPRLYRVRQ